jgi:hypothetical protein
MIWPLLGLFLIAVRGSNIKIIIPRPDSALYIGDTQNRVDITIEFTRVQPLSSYKVTLGGQPMEIAALPDQFTSPEKIVARAVNKDVYVSRQIYQLSLSGLNDNGVREYGLQNVIVINSAGPNSANQMEDINVVQMYTFDSWNFQFLSEPALNRLYFDGYQQWNQVNFAQKDNFARKRISLKRQ